ncbi:MAG: hypothetical protein GY922_15485 [Proteobacteria bacterium]|nr:hypothetical protein [Pseudomonadota bacterium]
MKHRYTITALMGLGFVVMALGMGTSSTAFVAGTLALDKTHRFGHPSRKYVSGIAYLIEWTPGKQIDRPISWNLYANRTGNSSGWRRALSNLNPQPESRFRFGSLPESCQSFS